MQDFGNRAFEQTTSQGQPDLVKGVLAHGRRGGSSGSFPTQTILGFYSFYLQF